MKVTKPFLNCLLALLLLTTLSNCTGYQKSDRSQLVEMPAKYPLQNDSVNSAQQVWSDFFADSVLRQLIESGLKSNLNLLTAFQRIELARSGLKFSQQSLLPNLNANITGAQRKFGLYTMDGAGNIVTEMEPGTLVPIHLPDYFVGLQTSWEIDVWGKLKNKKKAALARYLETVEARKYIQTNLISEIAVTYYHLVALDNQLEILRETIKLQDEALQIAEVQKQAGVTNELAVEQFEAQLLSSRALELEVLQDITESESRINYLLGRYPQNIIRNKRTFTKQLPFSIRVGLPADLLRNRPDVKQAEYALAAAHADVGSARAAFYPSLTITGSLGYQAYKTSLLFASPESMAYALLGGLTAPLLNRKEIKLELRRSMAQKQMALYEYQNTVINGFTEAHNEMSRIQRFEKMLEFKTKEAEVMQLSIGTSSELFKTGRANYMEVLMAQRNALRSRLELVTTQEKQYSAVVKLYKSLGGGWQ